MSLEQLVGMHRFVRDVPVAKLIDHQDESVDSLSPFSVPKEVWLMVDYLSVNARETVSREPENQLSDDCLLFAGRSFHSGRFKK